MASITIPWWLTEANVNPLRENPILRGLILSHRLILEKLTCKKYVHIIANENVDNLLLCLLTYIKESHASGFPLQWALQCYTAVEYVLGMVKL